MADILFSTKSKTEVDRYISKPSHAVLLLAPIGYGKLTIARYISSQLLKLDLDKELDNYAYFFEVKPENKLISIDKIRELKKLFILKTTGSNEIRRVVVIEDADYMNDESQNALLKILEEPPRDSVIILTAKNEKNLKPTILSRIQSIRLHKPTLNEADSFFTKQNYKSRDIRRNYLFTNGSIGLINSLLSGEGDNQTIDHIDEVKKLLSSSYLDRLAVIDDWSKDKENLSSRMYSLKQIVRSALFQSLEKDEIKKTKYWLNALDSVQKSENSLAKGANVKLLLTDMFLHM
jgi:hypothetical protein